MTLRCTRIEICMFEFEFQMSRGTLSYIVKLYGFLCSGLFFKNSPNCISILKDILNEPKSVNHTLNVTENCKNVILTPITNIITSIFIVSFLYNTHQIVFCILNTTYNL